VESSDKGKSVVGARVMSGAVVVWNGLGECQQPREKQQSAGEASKRLFGSLRSGNDGNEGRMKRYSPPRMAEAPAGQAINGSLSYKKQTVYCSAPNTSCQY